MGGGQSPTPGQGQQPSQSAQAQKQAAFIKQDLEAKIAKLQARVKELQEAGAGNTGSSGSRRGFFSR